MPYSPGLNAGNVGTIGNLIVGGVGGSILYVDAAGNLAQDNMNLFWDAPNARLGIRTLAPAVAVHIAAGAGGGLQVDDAVILGSAGGLDTLTINTPTVTLGANISATRAAGALPAGGTTLFQVQATYTGDAGGTTTAQNTFRVTGSGANNVSIQRSLYLESIWNSAATLTTVQNVVSEVENAGAGPITTGQGFLSFVAITGAGNITTARTFTAAAPVLSSTGAITTLQGFHCGNIGHATLIGTAVAFKADDITASITATRGFQGSLAAGTGKRNLFMDGTATNFLQGKLMVNSNVDMTFGTLGCVIQAAGGNSESQAIASARFSADTTGGLFTLFKSRNIAPGSFTIVQNNDAAGQITFAVDDGVDYDSQIASILAQVDGVPAANDTPGRLVFSTASPGANVVTERLRITSGGVVVFSRDRAPALNNQTSAAAAAAGTLANAPAAGDPGFWLKIAINGTNYAIPCWIG